MDLKESRKFRRPPQEISLAIHKGHPGLQVLQAGPLWFAGGARRGKKVSSGSLWEWYRGVGHKLPVRFDWLDGFGNKTNWNSKSFPNPQSFGVRLGYTDELIGVERRPAVSAGYAREAKDITKPELAIMFDLM
jgi:hypothetical protein